MENFQILITDDGKNFKLASEALGNEFKPWNSLPYNEAVQELENYLRTTGDDLAAFKIVKVAFDADEDEDLLVNITDQLINS